MQVSSLNIVRKPYCKWLSIDADECLRIFQYRYWKSVRVNEVICGADESTLYVIDTTIDTNECPFSANKQQKVYLQNQFFRDHYACNGEFKKKLYQWLQTKTVYANALLAASVNFETSNLWTQDIWKMIAINSTCFWQRKWKEVFF